MMTVGNSALLLEAAQTCFMSPFPSPAQRQAGRQAGDHMAVYARPRPAAMTSRGGPVPQPRPGPAWFGSARFGSVRFGSLPPSPCLSCHAATVTSRSGLQWGCQALPPLTEQSKGPSHWPKNRGKDPSETGSGKPVALAHAVLLGEQCQPERKWQLPIIPLFGDKEKTRSSRY